jgi:hypothetical protein|nr:MAG TPA: hypothetical protein [Caudoviricetes sp.]DAT16407.1 MAG TPA: hypothetical protein [Caudoviricetes sp.]
MIVNPVRYGKDGAETVPIEVSIPYKGATIYYTSGGKDQNFYTTANGKQPILADKNTLVCLEGVSYLPSATGARLRCSSGTIAVYLALP